MKHKTPTLTQEQRRLIEALGVALERSNVAPAPARIMALLHVSPVVELPFEDISSLLNLSKSATSNALNQLLALGRIEYVTHPGERRRYFRCHLMHWKEEADRQVKRMGAMAHLMGTIAASRPNSTPEFNAKLNERVEFMRFVVGGMADIVAKWEKRRR